MASYQEINQYRFTPETAAVYQPSLDYIQSVLTPFLLSLQRSDSPRILDVGGGPGFIAQTLQRCGYTTVNADLSFIGLRIARENGIAGVQALGDTLPFASNSFDAAHCKDSLVHIYNKQRFLREISDTIRVNGQLLLVTETTPHSRAHWTLGNSPTHTTYIQDEAEYRKFVRITTAQGMKVSPPYYTTDKDAIISMAQAYKLNLISERTWQPIVLPGEVDCYPQTRTKRTIPRTVMTFRKAA